MSVRPCLHPNTRFKLMVSQLAILLLTMQLTACGSGSAAAGSTAAVTPPTSNPAPTPPLLTVQIATAANSWVDGNLKATETIITEQGIRNWTNASDQIVTFIRLPQAGELELALDGRAATGTSSIEVRVGAQSKTLSLSNTQTQQLYVGKFQVDTAGYTKVVLQGITSGGSTFADIDQLRIGGSATVGVNGATDASAAPQFIKDEFYWGRRGPSVHLNYPSPTSEPVEYFYSEVTVPQGQDQIGSYFMTNGFGEGYFGIQVNSAEERRVLFSVWSPFQTDDPSKIPAEDRVTLLKKGEGVTIGEFGNEGSGGQSYLRYPWQAGQSYRFLLKATPAAENRTTYTAWFYPAESGKWQLIASFSRPKTQTYLRHHHAFLENFITEAGQFSREARYGNQWVRTQAGQWLPLLQASFSYDDTAARKSRWDYQGGVKDGQFYLKNGGFFADYTKYDSKFSRTATAAPELDLTQLP